MCYSICISLLSIVLYCWKLLTCCSDCGCADLLQVLDEGKIIAFDKPLSLLENKESALYKMVAEMGAEETKRLLAIAGGLSSPFAHLATSMSSVGGCSGDSGGEPLSSTTYDVIASPPHLNACVVDGEEVSVYVDEQDTEKSALLSNHESGSEQQGTMCAGNSTNVHLSDASSPPTVTTIPSSSERNDKSIWLHIKRHLGAVWLYAVLYAPVYSFHGPAMMYVMWL